ncbi:ABC transporter ATP-binding protein [Inconstantimicrobium mannanitabidum]|uniref:ABC transporter ATP-binding protein n=1 Tax=Inconstantimicrobium mannanitabidum TaxID=1604901 RepID=A0ACB5RDC8_9CLOT|nr:ATP-binding cassette domain-containing protein [Clostridium sp. TW13]GKX66769.1 ABC transporter ATP-binding protein [Clostridium sp. TW13]
MIELENVCKTFKVHKRNAGLGKAVKSLFKREYDMVKALDNISFKIADGEMVGYIGPNGAGKSTTIKIMSGILYPDKGKCLINDKVPWQDRVSHVKDIGVVFGQRSQLWWDVAVGDSYELLKEIYKIPDKKYKDNLMMLTDLLDIEELIKMPTRQLSLGQRMRCEIAAALLHSPKILFLDEPTIGLDAVSKIAVREFIKTINKENKTTVILTTHDTQDIEALTKRIVLIGKGKVLLDGNLEDLKQNFSKERTMSLEYSGELKDLPQGLRILSKQSGRAALSIDTEIISTSKAISNIADMVDLRDFSLDSVSTEDVVVGLYKEYKI